MPKLGHYQRIIPCRFCQLLELQLLVERLIGCKEFTGYGAE